MAYALATSNDLDAWDQKGVHSLDGPMNKTASSMEEYTAGP